MPNRGPKHHVTLADVAARAGVAKSTASEVFAGSHRVAEATAAKVREAAEELGYAGPSALGRALARGRTNVVAVMTRALLEDPDTDPLSLAVIDGAIREFARAGFACVLLPPITDDASRALADSVQFDAVVTIRRMEGFSQTDPYLRSRKVPWMPLDGDNDEHLAVTMDDRRAMTEVIDHLRALGHHRIGVVTLRFTPDKDGDGWCDMDQVAELSRPNIRRRLEGIRDAGLVPAAVYSCSFVDYAKGRQAGLAMLELEPPPTAIVCLTDLHAAGVIDALESQGLAVPGDVSVTGVDGLPMDRLGVHRLTTVVQDGFAKGAAVARYVVAQIDGKRREPEHIPVTLRVGTTTGPARETHIR